MEKVYVLTETDSEDPNWCYNEVFLKREDAVKRMDEIYHEEVIERDELFVEGNIGKWGASAMAGNGKIVAWNICECEVQ